MEIYIAIFGGVVAGAVLGFVLAKLTSKQEAILRSENTSLTQETARLRLERDAKEQAAIAALEKAAAWEAKNVTLTDNFVQLQDQMRLQFEGLARQIFEENSTRFTEQSHKGLGDLLTPLKERISEFHAKVDKSFGDQAKEQFALKNEIERIVKVSQTMGTQTENLTKALKGDVKAQGNWGEVMLERILEASGLRAGIDYSVQAESLSLRNMQGQLQKPDVIVNLPEGRHIIIDAKVSLTHYERYVAAADEKDRLQHFQFFLDSVRSHVKGLSDKNYQRLDRLDTPDFVMMFMPIEGAYALAIQEDPQLHSYAWERKIVLVCPATLFATLRTVASLWRMENQSQNAIKIAQESGLLYDKFVGFVEDMQGIGKQIERTQAVYGEAMNKLTTGRGNLIRKTEQLKIMGAKTAKALPAELVLEAEEEAA